MRRYFIFLVISGIVFLSNSALAETIVVKTSDAGIIGYLIGVSPVIKAFKGNYVRPMDYKSITSKGQFIENLPSLFRHHILKADDHEEAAYIVEQLKERLDVSYAYIEPHYEPAVRFPDRNQPATEIAPTPYTTLDSYVHLQDYLYPPPVGVNAVFAWAMPGGRGENVQVADLEWGWDIQHNDLASRMLQIIGVGVERDDHGTAVMGEMIASDNEFGVTGIVPEASAMGVSVVGFDDPTVAEYIMLAAARLSAGDVMLLEMHTDGPNSKGYDQDGFVPMEYFPANFEAIKATTDLGIHVVEAAGNGGENLDAPLYERRFDRSFCDSGAILVGAAAPPRESVWRRQHLERLDFSNYGSAVDIMAYGDMVTTTGYGDLFHRQEGNFYTAEFGGTSSASPIVTGTVAAISSMAKARGLTISPARMREILRETATPQAHTGLNGTIGGMPDILKAWQLATLPNLPTAVIEAPATNVCVVSGAEVSFAAEGHDGYDYQWRITNAADGGEIATYEGRQMSHAFATNGRYIVELTVAKGTIVGLAPAFKEVVVDDLPSAPQLSYEPLDAAGLIKPVFRFSPINMIAGDCYIEVSVSENFAEDDIIIRQRIWWLQELEDHKVKLYKDIIQESGNYFARMRCRTGLGDSPYSNIVSTSFSDQIEGATTSVIREIGGYDEEILALDDRYIAVRSYFLQNGEEWVNTINVFAKDSFLSEAARPVATLDVGPFFAKALIRGGFLFTANGVHPLRIFAVPNITQAGLVDTAASLHLGVSADDIVILGDTLYVFSNEGEIIFVNISDPVHPLISRRFSLNSGIGSVRDSAVVNGAVFFATSHGVVRADPSGAQEFSLNNNDIVLKGIASTSDDLIVAVSPSQRENENPPPPSVQLKLWRNGELSPVAEFPTNCDGLKFINDTLFILKDDGFYALTADFRSIAFTHRSATRITPRPWLIGDHIIGVEDQNYIEYQRN